MNEAFKQIDELFKPATLERANHSLMSSISTLEDIPVIVKFGVKAEV